MANVKMTKKDYFNALATLVETTNSDNADALTAFINHEIELLNKKTSFTKPTKTQAENENVKTAILTALEEIGKPVTISEMQAQTSELADYSNQKLSAILRLMCKANTVVKSINKKKTYFSAQGVDIGENTIVEVA